MDIWELVTTGLCLSMDALSVAVCKGLSLKKIKLRHCVTVGLYFGIFQALMPLIGFLLASTFASKISDYSFYIAFALLLIIGINMIKEAFSDEQETSDASFSPKSMVPLAVATSIDALAVGISFALVNVKIIPAVSIIGITTFIISGIGVSIGSFVGGKFQKTATVIGGAVLILIGTKILLEGLNIL